VRSVGRGPALLALFLAACGAEELPRASAEALARGFEPAPLAALAATWRAAAPELGFRPAADGSGLWLEQTLDEHAWQASGKPGEFWCPRPRTAGFEGQTGERVELTLAGRTLRQVHPLEVATAELGAGFFFLVNTKLVVRLPASEVPRGPATFASFLERGAREDGVFRAVVVDTVGDGLAVWPGERARLALDGPASSVLHVRTQAQSLGPPGEVVFRIALDGEELLAARQPLDGAPRDHALALGPRARPSATLEFAVDGPPALSAFFTPRVLPAAPPQPTRDVVLVVLDTLRADALSAAGGPPGLTPALDRLAARSRNFTQARASSTWTLPTHASLFTGLWPLQHGAIDEQSTFAPELPTLPAFLAAHGYRTGAVTDSGFVSRRYGFARGFEWFHERELADHDLGATLAAARAFLAVPDGRPRFLFVHTYRAHTPYRSGPDEDARAMRALDAEFEAALARLPAGEPRGALLREFGARYAALYHEGVRALDAELAPFLREFEPGGAYEHALLVVTSDHGEAFGEHGALEHGGLPHEEQLRIPLLLAGPGLAAGDVAHAAGLEDLPRTLATYLGLAPEPRWGGTDLLLLDAPRTVFAHVAYRELEALAVLDGTHKLLAAPRVDELAAGRVKFAFDLAADPEERTNLATSPWASELARRAAPLFEPLTRPLAARATVELEADQRGDLRALGYGE